MSPGEVRDKHRSRVEALLIHARENVTHYRTLINQAGCSLDDIRQDALGALGLLPILTKASLRENFEALKASDLDTRRWRYNMSGGSTGKPVRVIQDSDYAAYNHANKSLYDLWSGYRIGQPKVLLWGALRDLREGSETLKTRIGRWLRNDHWCNTFRMSEADMRAHVARINAIRPVQILAYVESAYELARFVERERLEMHRPASVMTSAGALQPHMRTVIERVFQAPVFNRYGSREVGDIACECEQHQGLHINPLTHHVEVVRPDGTPCSPGETGEVVITLLTNYAMPLIRYRTEDLAAWSERVCSCGCYWPSLERVDGRVNSVIRTDSGTFDSRALSSVLYAKDSQRTEFFRSFLRYQLIQMERNHIILKVLVEKVNQDLWEEEKQLVKAQLNQILGKSVRVDVERVSDMEPSPSGKHQYIWSRVG
jgi:phenylacetate-CoA ligase